MSEEYRHPDGTDAPRYVGVYREWKAEVDDDGYYETDADPETLVELGFLDELPDDEPETCEEIKTDGEVCGREKPCPYHSED